MNRYLHPYYHLDGVDEYFEAPLDQQVVKEISSASGKDFSSTFKIYTLKKEQSDQIQVVAKSLAEAQQRKRYELDILYWNQEKIADLMRAGGKVVIPDTTAIA